jgi:hypothetical protein
MRSMKVTGAIRDTIVQIDEQPDGGEIRGRVAARNQRKGLVLTVQGNVVGGRLVLTLS